MQTKFEYEKITFYRVSAGKNYGKVQLIETDGFLVKDLPLDWIELVVHRTPITKDKWLVSERTSGHRMNAIECETTKNDAVVEALKIISQMPRDKVEEFIEEKRGWREYYETRVGKLPKSQDTH